VRSPLEALDLPPGATHACQALDSAFWGYSPHQHDGCELMWIRGGHGVAEIGERTVPFGEDDLFLVGSRVPHSFHSEPSRPPAARLRALIVRFADHASPLIGCEGFKRALPLMISARRGLRLGGPAANQVRKRMLKLRGARQMRGLADFCDLIDLLCGCRVEPLLPKSAAADPASGAPNSLFAAASTIEQRMREPLDLARLAELTRLSRSTLCAAFRKHFDCSPMAYLAERRLARACALLGDRQRRIVDIAYACGFNSLATFNRRFARAKGMPPSDWRERNAP
jgi:AraC-like DNA-binding protein